MSSVLIVEDEAKIRAVVRDALRGEVDRVLETTNATEGIGAALAERPDLIVLDLGLPDMDGIELCRTVRGWSSVPIVVLSARHSEEEKALLLDAGADDYITKPFGTTEFRARIRAQLRRSRMRPIPGGDAPITVGDLTIDVASRRVTRAGEPVHLTPTEWDVLRELVTHAGRTLTHQHLFASVWKQSYGDAQQYLRVYIAHLRRKLEQDPYDPRLIRTDPGVGYRFEWEP